jgi:nucleotide-binding universal stress UspA family protein
MMIKNILVPLDGSALAECVLPHVVAMVQAFDARVTLLQVVEGTSPNRGGRTIVSPLEWHMYRAEAEGYLAQVSNRLEDIGVEVERAILEGSPAKRIIEFARKQDIRLLMLSSHGRSGLSEWGISSVIQKVTMRCLIPILIVRAYKSAKADLTGLRYEHVMVPLDMSHRAEHVLPLVNMLAEAHESRLLLAHVVTRPELPRRMPLTTEEREFVDRLTETNRQEGEAYLEELKAHLSPKSESRVLISYNAAAELHKLVSEEDVDLVVMSAHGSFGQAHWPYGGLATNFISYCSTALLIVQDLSPEEVLPTEAEKTVREKKGH